MIAVFKTNITDQNSMRSASKVLHQTLNLTNVTFDLKGCNTILRVESDSNCNQLLIETLNSWGFECEVLSACIDSISATTIQEQLIPSIDHLTPNHFSQS